MDPVAALLVLAAEENSTAYEIGKVFGRVLVIVAIVALVYWLGQRFIGRDKE